MARSRGIVAALAVLAAIGVARRAEATPSARLVYVRLPGAEDCPDEAALRRAVASRLGYDPFFPHARDTLIAEVERKGSSVRVRMKLVDEASLVRGARDIEATTSRCEELTGAMALTMSIAIDPESITRAPGEPPPETRPSEPEPPKPPPPEPSKPAPVVATPAPSAPEPPAPPRGQPAQLELRVAGHGWVGAAPSASVGATVGVGVAWPVFALAIEGRADAPASAAVDRGRVATSFVGGGLSGCAVLARVLRGCGIVEGGRLAASAEGIASPREDASAHLLVGLRGALALPLTERLSALVQLDGRYSLTPQRLQIDGTNAYSVPRVSGGLGLGLLASFF